MSEILKTGQAGPRLLRRTFLALTALSIPAIYASKYFQVDLTEGQKRALALLEQGMEGFKHDPREARTLSMLEIFKKKLKNEGQVTSELPVLAITLYNYHEEGSKIILDEIHPAIHEGLVNSSWQNRNVQYLLDSFVSICLKEAVYFAECEKDPKGLITKISCHHEFAKKLHSIKKAKEEKEQFIALVQNTDLLESAKKYIAQFTHWEYIGYKAQLEFLHRRGFTTEARAKMRQDRAIYQDQFLAASFLSNLERMGFVSKDGILDSSNLKKTIARNMLETSQRTAKVTEDLSDNALWSAFNIILATSPKYKETANTVEIFEETNLFNFVNDEKYVS